MGGMEGTLLQIVLRLREEGKYEIKSGGLHIHWKHRPAEGKRSKNVEFIDKFDGYRENIEKLSTKKKAVSESLVENN